MKFAITFTFNICLNFVVCEHLYTAFTIKQVSKYRYYWLGKDGRYLFVT